MAALECSRMARRKRLRGFPYTCLVFGCFLVVFLAYSLIASPEVAARRTTELTGCALNSDTESYPNDLILTWPYCQSNHQYAVIIHLVGVLYMFYGLAVVCDVYFVGALEIICEKWQLSEDVAGATFMAAGGSAPEFFTNVLAVRTTSDVGVGTIVGSAVFNVLFVIAACAVFAGAPLELTWWPLFRDCVVYVICLCILTVFMSDSEIHHWEAAILFALYLGYVLIMKFNGPLNRWFAARLPFARRLEAEEHARHAAHHEGGGKDPQQKAAAAAADGHAPKGPPAGATTSRSSSKVVPEAVAVSGVEEASGPASEVETSAVTPLTGGRASGGGGGGAAAKKDPPVAMESCDGSQQTAAGGGVGAADEAAGGRRASKQGSLSLADSMESGGLGPGGGYARRKSAQSVLAKARRKSYQGAALTEGDMAEMLQAQDSYRTKHGGGGVSPMAAGARRRSQSALGGQEPIPEDRSVKPPPQAAETKVDPEVGNPLVKKLPEEEEEEDDEDLMRWPAEGTTKDKVLFCLGFPVVAALHYTIPDCTQDKYKNFYWVTFVLSLVWITFFAYFMVWWVMMFGEIIRVPSAVMGITIIAAGTSIPDALSSVSVAVKGFGDMAVSSSIGSNIFDILVGLPIPWLAYTLISGQTQKIQSSGLLWSIITLILMVVAVVFSIMYTGWVLDHKLGGIMMILYILFLIESIILAFV